MTILTTNRFGVGLLSAIGFVAAAATVIASIGFAWTRRDYMASQGPLVLKDLLIGKPQAHVVTLPFGLDGRTVTSTTSTCSCIELLQLSQPPDYTQPDLILAQDLRRLSMPEHEGVVPAVTGPVDLRYLSKDSGRLEATMITCPNAYTEFSSTELRVSFSDGSEERVDISASIAPLVEGWPQMARAKAVNENYEIHLFPEYIGAIVDVFLETPGGDTIASSWSMKNPLLATFKRPATAEEIRIVVSIQFDGGQTTVWSGPVRGSFANHD